MSRRHARRARILLPILIKNKLLAVGVAAGALRCLVLLLAFSISLFSYPIQFKIVLLVYSKDATHVGQARHLLDILQIEATRDTDMI